MIAALILGALLGIVAGILYGVFIAATTRDGIWPEAWAILIIVSTFCGTAIGALAWVMT